MVCNNTLASKLSSVKQLGRQLMAYYFAVILICLCPYFIRETRVASASNDAKNGYKGHYGHWPGRYDELVYPAKVTQNGEFVSHIIPHHYKRSYYETMGGKDMGPEDALHYVVPIAGEKHHLQLYPSNAITTPSMVVEVHDDKQLSKRIIRKLGNVRCHYIGTVKGQEDSKVAVSTCKGLTGYVRTKRGLFFIEPAAGHNPLTEQHHPHLLYQHETDPPTFETNCYTFGNIEAALSKDDDKNLEKRELPEEVVSRLPVKPIRELYIETLIVLDKSFLDYHQQIDVENYVLTVFNMAHDLYHDATLKTNINLVIVRMIRLEDEEHELNLAVNKNPKETLEFFSSWQNMVNPPDDTHPNHHDVAVLLTRIDICGDDGNCGLLGAAVLGGMCDPKRQAALCEDNGLRLGFIIAHEIAHTLAIPHDTPLKSGCKGVLPEGLTTVMNPSVDIRTAEWSECSAKYLQFFIEQGLEECLHDPPTEHSFEMPDILPGVTYGGDFQCRQLLGPKAALCNTGLECDNLICYVANIGCIETYTYAAPGTNCGEKKWCIRGKCCALGERPGAIDGGWSDWSKWSECSRSCGSGVSTRNRHCDNPTPMHGGKYCIGKRTSHKLCNTQPCPLGEPSFRAVQCAEFNDWVYPEDNKLHTWKDYFIPEENPCTLLCENEEGTVAALLPRVIDGTKCHTGKRSICIDGLCTEIPCDFDLDSEAVEDACGVCRGNGTTCKLVEDEVIVPKTDADLIKILEIPQGSVNIMIEETEPGDAQIQIKSEDDDTILVTGDQSGFFDVPGSKAWLGNIRTRQQALTIRGPISSPINIWIVMAENTVIQYSYGQDNVSPRVPQVDWDYVDWSKCSSICGPGTRVSMPKCIERYSGLVDNCHCEKIKKPPPKVIPCEKTPCIPRWFIGGWMPCDCFKRIRIRMVKCIKPTGEGEGEWEIIFSDICVGEKPKTEEYCECSRRQITEIMKTKTTCAIDKTTCIGKFNQSKENSAYKIDKESVKDLVLIVHKEQDDEYNYATPRLTTMICGKAVRQFENQLQQDYKNKKAQV